MRRSFCADKMLREAPFFVQIKTFYSSASLYKTYVRMKFSKMLE